MNAVTDPTYYPLLQEIIVIAVVLSVALLMLSIVVLAMVGTWWMIIFLIRHEPKKPIEQQQYVPVMQIPVTPMPDQFRASAAKDTWAHVPTQNPMPQPVQPLQ